MTESTNFAEKIASSLPPMKGNTDISNNVKMSRTVYRFRISMVRKRRVRVGFSTISAREPSQTFALRTHEKPSYLMQTGEA